MNRNSLLVITMRSLCLFSAFNLVASYVAQSESSSVTKKINAPAIVSALLFCKRDFQTRGYLNSDLRLALAKGNQQALEKILRIISKESENKQAYLYFAQDMASWTKTEAFKRLPRLQRIALWSIIFHHNVADDKFIKKIGRKSIKNHDSEAIAAMALRLRGHLCIFSKKKKGINFTQKIVLFNSSPSWQKKRVSIFTTLLEALDTKDRDALLQSNHALYHECWPGQEGFYCATQKKIDLSIKGLVLGGWVLDTYALLAQVANLVTFGKQDVSLSDKNLMLMTGLTDRVECLVKPNATKTNDLLRACAHDINQNCLLASEPLSSDSSSEGTEEAPYGWWQKFITFF